MVHNTSDGAADQWPQSQLESLQTAAKLVENTAYDSAGIVHAEIVSQLVKIAAEIERIAKQIANTASD